MDIPIIIIMGYHHDITISGSMDHQDQYCHRRHHHYHRILFEFDHNITLLAKLLILKVIICKYAAHQKQNGLEIAAMAKQSFCSTLPELEINEIMFFSDELGGRASVIIITNFIIWK